MDWLNYHHLRYFWQVARLGSIARAAEALRVAPPTISTQIKELEEQLGEQLFERSGRKMHLTDVGRVHWQVARIEQAIDTIIANPQNPKTMWEPS